MSLKERITEDMKNAMRAKDSERLGTIRLLLAAIKQREVDERIVLDDANVIAVTDKLIKQRKDSFSQFQAAGRDDLAAKEASELLVLQEYMPQQLSPEEVAAAVQAAVTETGAAGPHGRRCVAESGSKQAAFGGARPTDRDSNDLADA